jgi:hypothetical protein
MKSYIFGLNYLNTHLKFIRLFAEIPVANTERVKPPEFVPDIGFPRPIYKPHFPFTTNHLKKAYNTYVFFILTDSS